MRIYPSFLTSLISFLFLSSGIAASPPDYELFFLENATYVDYSVADFRESLGEDTRLLDYYLCDGKQEFEVFRPLPVENEKRDSLRIQETPKDEVLVYRDGGAYRLDGSPIKKVTGYFNRQVFSALKNIESVPSGAQLLRLLEKSRYPLAISFGPWVSYRALREENQEDAAYVSQAIAHVLAGRISSKYPPIRQLGMGGKVFWKPEILSTRWETDGNMRKVQPFVALSHELFHAYDGIRGLMDVRKIKPSKKYESIEISEYRAMYFENQIRKESGLRYAVHYIGSEFKDPGLLDLKGDPVFFPSPCLDRL